MRFFPPIHNPESVALELLKGLEDGSITLGKPGLDVDADERAGAIQLDALRAECEANRDRTTAELAAAAETHRRAETEASMLVAAAQAEADAILARAVSSERETTEAEDDLDEDDLDEGDGRHGRSRYRKAFRGSTKQLIEFISRLPISDQRKIRTALARKGRERNPHNPPADDGT